MSESTLTALTSEEVQAGLSLEQLKQLVGLVEYDASERPVPGRRPGRRLLRGRQRHPDRDLLPARAGHGARGLPRPRERPPRLQVLRAALRQRPVRLHRRRHPRQPGRSTTTAGTATASSTSRIEVTDVDKCIEHARLDGRDGPGRAARRVRRARHRADRRDRDVRRDPAHAGRPQPLRRPLPARLRRPDEHRGPPRGPPEAAVPGHRPLRRQRRARPDGRVGRVLQQGARLHEHGRVRRRRHRHRLLRADEQGRRQRQPPGEVPAQRAGDREEEVADRRVPRVLRRRRLPAHRARDQRHPALGRHPARQRHRVPRRPPTPTTTTPSCAPGSARCGSRSRS